jgi:hypothetical protein
MFVNNPAIICTHRARSVARVITYRRSCASACGFAVSLVTACGDSNVPPPVEGGSGGASSTTQHHDCTQPYPVDARDATMTGAPVQLDVADGQYDLQVPAEIRAWLEEQNWVEQHGNWHLVRRCDGGLGAPGGAGGGPPGAGGGFPGVGGGFPGVGGGFPGVGGGFPGGGGGFPGGNTTEILAERGLSCAAIQEGETGDGLAFLAMHRHMLLGLQQAFPQSFQSIRAFTHVPLSKEDSENPFPWKEVEWTADQLAALELLEQIEDNLDLFETEDDFAGWVQFGTQYGAGRDGVPNAAVHGDLHAQFTVPKSPYSLLDNEINTVLLPFWRLHGWIDAMWTRYRAANGLSDDDPTYRAVLVAQCEEMHLLTSSGHEGHGGAGTNETGVFAESVMPIFRTYCTGCHSAGTSSAGLTLTGNGVTAAQVRGGLVGAPSTETRLALVEPGAPDDSWLVRKIEGNFDGIDCQSCKTTMPQAGSKPSEADVATIRAWIAAGATAD